MMRRGMLLPAPVASICKASLATPSTGFNLGFYAAFGLSPRRVVKDASGLQGTGTADGIETLPPATVIHAEVTEVEVVANGIARIERPESRRDLARGLEVGGGTARHAERPGITEDVRVERHDQAGRRDSRPGSEIDVAFPDHPAQVEEEALGRAPLLHVGELPPEPEPSPVDVARPSREDRIAEASEREHDVGLSGLVSLEEQGLESSPPVGSGSHEPDELGQVPRPRHPVREAVTEIEGATGILARELLRLLRGRGPEPPEQLREDRQEQAHLPVGERARVDPRDLLVARALVAADEAQ